MLTSWFASWYFMVLSNSHDRFPCPKFRFPFRCRDGQPDLKELQRRIHQVSLWRIRLWHVSGCLGMVNHFPVRIHWCGAVFDVFFAVHSESWDDPTLMFSVFVDVFKQPKWFDNINNIPIIFQHPICRFGTFFIFAYIGNVIIPTDEAHHFSEG